MATPSSKELLDSSKKNVDALLATILRDVERADLDEVLEKFASHLDDVQDRIEGHREALEEEELGDEEDDE